MPQELLGDVFRTGDAPGRTRRRFSILPLSIAAHALAGAGILIIPLAAEVELPTPIRPSIQMMEIVPAPLPPEPAVQRPANAQAATPAVAPIEAPPNISDIEPPAPGPVGPIVDGALAIGPPGAGPGIGTVVTIAPPLPPPPPPAEPRRPGGNIREPKKVFDVAPVYPTIAINARKEGTVILEVVIDESGAVSRMRVLRSEPLLDEAAMAAVKRWRYTPTLLNNVPIPILMTVTVRFTLQ